MHTTISQSYTCACFAYCIGKIRPCQEGYSTRCIPLGRDVSHTYVHVLLCGGECTCASGRTKPSSVRAAVGRSSTEMGAMRYFLPLWSVLPPATPGEYALSE